MDSTRPTFLSPPQVGLVQFTGQRHRHTRDAPNWPLGIACGLGGYIGALLQPRMPDTALRRILGLLATGLAASYLIDALT